MVNNYKERAGGICFAAALFLFLLFSSFPGLAQKISKRYVSYPQPSGLLYYIYPQGGFYNSKLNSSLKFDITYLSGKDSAIFNFSYFDKANKTIDSIAFAGCDKRSPVFSKKLFVETKGSKWFYRGSATLPLSALQAFFSCQEPQLVLVAKEETVYLRAKPHTWKKTAAVTNKIFTLIALNKK